MFEVEVERGTLLFPWSELGENGQRVSLTGTMSNAPFKRWRSLAC